ncbi:MAG: nickel pincer cofactor biosynthesis protein LarB [Spirochaetes bacterium]|nr:nickel pincer cofactor biosynthesis protein LarB [Spirochaetota bacterium]
MQKDELIKILNRYKSGEIPEKDILNYFENLPFEDISFAKIDHHREMRFGFPEVIFCQNKTPEQVAIISEKIIKQGSNLLATKASSKIFESVKKYIPDVEYNETAGTITYINNKIKKLPGKVLIVTAGTSDIPVASESLVTGEMLGLDITMINDIGVAGIHRLMEFRNEFISASVIIVIAGMEGALASVIAGLIQSPVIAVPTSIGYGASFNGISPLLGMLNSCVPGIAVMNIDNGFGAASLAFKILNSLDKLKTTD